MRLLAPLVFLSWCSSVLSGADAPAVAEGRRAEVRSDLAVFSTEWAPRLPPNGAVNYPNLLATVYPGQRVVVGILTSGAGHDTRLNGAVLRMRLAVAGREVETREGLRAIASRRIKAQGMDFVLVGLQAAGISEQERTEVLERSAAQTLALTAPEWIVPAVEKSTNVELSVEVSGVAAPVAISPTKLRIKITADWLKEPSLSRKETGQRMNRYLGDPAPGELLSWFVAMADGIAGREIPGETVLALAFRSSNAARAAAIAAFPGLSPDLHPALLRVFRLGGHDVGELFPELPPDQLDALAALKPVVIPRSLPRFTDPVDPQAVSQIGHAMDRCWAGWMVTGDKTYLRALVDLLESAPDFPAYKAWTEAQGGPKGLNARVARGLAYQIAGWSIGSFQRTDPLVADWLAYWQNDPSVPALVRKEIADLPLNPVFRRGQTPSK